MACCAVDCRVVTEHGGTYLLPSIVRCEPDHALANREFLFDRIAAWCDAWGVGQSLEWATSSPPAPGNFGELATVTSPEPLLDLAEGGDR